MNCVCVYVCVFITVAVLFATFHTVYGKEKFVNRA